MNSLNDAFVNIYSNCMHCIAVDLSGLSELVEVKKFKVICWACVVFCFCVSVSCIQHCKIYLCGTKNDLVEADRSVRQIDYHDAQDFAEGKTSVSLM